MAHIESGGKGRNTNTELNLVPVIDLMSVLITFLLISAVWTQVSMIKLGASFSSLKDPNQKEITPPPLEDVVLKLEVRATGYVLFVGKDVRPIPMIQGAYDSVALEADLKKIKQLYPDKAGIKLAVSDEIIYEHLITAMDVGLRAGFDPELLTGGPN
jgi:biopolymer transport protein TolR